MLEFPTDFSQVQDAAKLVIDADSGADVGCDDLSRAYWNLAGYAKSQEIANRPPCPAPSPDQGNKSKKGKAAKTSATTTCEDDKCEPCEPCEPCSKAECCKHLQTIKDCHSGKMKAGMSGLDKIPWASLLKGLIMLLSALEQNLPAAA